LTATYLVTGGGGFIGSNIAFHLVEQGESVRVLDNFSSGRQSNLDAVRGRLDVVEGDIRDSETVRRACRGIEMILHHAALPSVERSVSDPQSTHDVNITGTFNVLQQALGAGVKRVVFASSSAIYGNAPELPKHERMLPEPASPYALSKLTGEYYCRLFHSLYGLETFSLRYFNVFGPRQDPASDYAAVIPLFIKMIRNGDAPVIHGDGGQTRDFTFVEDIVEANLCCCRAPADAAGGVYNVAWGDRVSILELVQRIARSMDRDVEPRFTESRAGDVRDSQADATLARERLGWQPRIELPEGLDRTVRWFDGKPAAR
jgi:UDP-N-acetylglucosamine 4-epimerase